MPETKSPRDFLSDGVLNYGVNVGRFVFSNTMKTVYAISDLPHIGASDVLMFYQISKINYQRLLAMSLPNRIPEPAIPASVTEPCRRHFLCGESVYCKRNSFTIFQADSALTEDTVQDHPAKRANIFRVVDLARQSPHEAHRAERTLLKAGRLKTLSEGMDYHLYRQPDGRILCETLCGECIIADSLPELQAMPQDKLELLIYSCEMNRAR